MFNETEGALSSSDEIGGGRAAILKKYGLRTLQEIVETEYPEVSPIVEGLVSPSETALLIARQKEGKSTLALQLAIDASLGEPFLGRYKTQKSSVLYVDYENRPRRLKERAKDLAGGRSLKNIVFKSFDLISERDVGLFGEEFTQLSSIVKAISPGLLVIDPLRYAITSETTDERAALNALDQVSKLKTGNSAMATLLVHHLKKAQDNFAPQLRLDPRAWIERVHGSQALLAHVDNIWGLEHDEAGHVFATVARSDDTVIIGLEREPDSQRFIVSSNPVQVSNLTPALYEAWNKLPVEFTWTEGLKLGIRNSTLDRLVRQSRAIGILQHDRATESMGVLG